MILRPLARESALLVETLGQELLVFDSERQLAHSLNPVASIVWRACNGVRDPLEIATHCGLDPDAVALALATLSDNGLLAQPMPSGEATGGVPGLSRRRMLKRTAAAGVGIGFGLPVITSIVVPSAAAAGSVGGGGAGPQCLTAGQICSGAGGTCCADLLCVALANGSICVAAINATCTKVCTNGLACAIVGGIQVCV